MNQIWTPWRMTYMNGHDQTDCVFCAATQQEDGPENLIVHRGQHAFVILNRYPYANGHVMIIPFEHQSDLEALSPVVRSEMMEMVTNAVTILREAYHPDAFNVGINIGAAAGAGLANHIHIHVVPRWNGDTNFMTTLAETRIIPETLEDTQRRLSNLWKLR